MTFCCMPAGIGSSFQTHGNSKLESKDGQTDRGIDIQI